MADRRTRSMKSSNLSRTAVNRASMIALQLQGESSKLLELYVSMKASFFHLFLNRLKEGGKVEALPRVCQEWKEEERVMKVKWKALSSFLGNSSSPHFHSACFVRTCFLSCLSHVFWSQSELWESPFFTRRF